MARQKSSGAGLQDALRAAALAQPGASEGVACKGTALESCAFQAKKKTFLFMRESELRLKLRESEAEAQQLAAREPARYRVGSLGWVTVSCDAATLLPLDLLKRWIDESYRVVTSK